MDLRTRILVGYAYLVSLIVISAVAAALGFHHLGSRLSKVLDENVASVRWSMEMVEALERQDSALLATLLGDDDANRTISESETAFLNALDKARTNVTEEREAVVIEQVSSAYDTFRGARDRLLSATHDRPLAAYHEQTFPAFEAVKASVRELLDVNHQAMLDADDTARATAGRRAVSHGLVVLLALVSFAWLSRALRRNVLDRLANLKGIAQAMARGDLDRRADATRSDELGLLAEQLNDLLDRDADLRGRMDARLTASHDLVLGVLAARPTPSVLFAPDGRVVAATTPDADVAPAKAALRDFRSGDANDHGHFEVQELVVGARPVGWLVDRLVSDDGT